MGSDRIIVDGAGHVRWLGLRETCAPRRRLRRNLWRVLWMAAGGGLRSRMFLPGLAADRRPHRSWHLPGI
jgi:hypothetical protein